jgi:hypothetical protein
MVKGVPTGIVASYDGIAARVTALTTGRSGAFVVIVDHLLARRGQPAIRSSDTHRGSSLSTRCSSQSSGV